MRNNISIMHVLIILGFIGFSFTIIKPTFAESTSILFNKVSQSSFPSIYDQWRSNLKEEYLQSFVIVMNEWYRGKPGRSPSEEDELINRFINQSKNAAIRCQEPILWKSKSAETSFVNVICNGNDFHITLIAWEDSSGSLIKTQFAGDKARPVTILEVSKVDEKFVLKGEQPPYEGEDIFTYSLQWDGNRFEMPEWKGE